MQTFSKYTPVTYQHQYENTQYNTHQHLDTIHTPHFRSRLETRVKALRVQLFVKLRRVVNTGVHISSIQLISCSRDDLCYKTLGITSHVTDLRGIRRCLHVALEVVEGRSWSEPDVGSFHLN